MPQFFEDSRDAELCFKPVRHPHIFGMWCYRQSDAAYADLRVGAHSFAQAGGSLCAVADIVDVTPDKVLEFLRNTGYVTPQSGVSTEGILTAIRYFGGSVLSDETAGLPEALHADDLNLLQKHLSDGMPALLFLNDSEGLDVTVVIAGYKEDSGQVLLFDPRGTEKDGWYSWTWVVSKIKVFVLVKCPPDDRYTPRSIFKRIYGVDIAGHEQRWPDIDIETLKNINPDCLGWIHLSGTALTYPIVADHLDATYYQTHNFSGEPSVHGAVSLSFANHGCFDGANLVFSAHRMKDYSMFKMLTFYDRLDFAKEHPFIDLILGTQNYQAHVFSAYCFPKNAGIHEPLKTSFPNESCFEHWLQQRIGLSMHTFPVPGICHQVATFRTCYGVDNDQVFVVHAHLVKV